MAERNIFRALVCTEKKRETSSPKTFSPNNSLRTKVFAPQKEVSPRQHSRRRREAVSSVLQDSPTPLLPPSPDRPRRRAVGGRGSSSPSGASMTPAPAAETMAPGGGDGSQPGREGGTCNENNDAAATTMRSRRRRMSQ